MRPSTPRNKSGLRLALGLWCATLAAAGCAGAPERTIERTEFARLVETLSEPGGYFDTDNLISNERSYLHALSELRQAGIRGGAYLGVGPDQNFSYIAAIEPELALIVDIRSDNVLQHLLFKALFHEAENRTAYLALLLGRPPPERLSSWNGASLERVLAYIGSTPATAVSARRSRAIVQTAIAGFGVALTGEDSATIERFHGQFIQAGLGLRFRSYGRAPQFYYPTLRDLITETDRDGALASYLATEEAYGVVRRLQLADRVVPVVADLAGPTALRAIGSHLRERGLSVSAFYTSNVEFYLFGDGTFARFIANLNALPLDERSVIVRSVFGWTSRTHPRTVPGYYSTQTVQPAALLVQRWEEGRYRGYRDVVTGDLLGSPRP